MTTLFTQHRGVLGGKTLRRVLSGVSPGSRNAQGSLHPFLILSRVVTLMMTMMGMTRSLLYA